MTREPDRESEKPPGPDAVTRRQFMAGGTTAMTAVAVSLAGASPAFLHNLLRKHFRELSPEEVERLMADMARDYEKRLGRQVSLTNTPALPDTLFGYALDLSRCVGCRRCVYACVHENNQSRDPQIQWIRVLQMEKSKGIELTEANPYYDPPQVPEEEHFYMPVACQHCANPPCVRVCPVEATWQEPDGIVVIDYDWCLGCRCCMSACPYGARHFNWAEPHIPAEEVNPDMHVLGNRLRTKGVVEKCTFCIHRVRKGRYPACVEICPVGARKFGNLLDPDGELRVLMREKRVFVLKEDLNTQPKFYYFYAT